jgi:alginate O-acetyltransferase complex protein AlgJ
MKRRHLAALLITAPLASTSLLAWAQTDPLGRVAAPEFSAATEEAARAFRVQAAAKAKAAAKTYAVTVRGRDGWMFFAPELRHVGAGTFWGAAAAKVSQSLEPENADPLPAILDFKAQLNKAGIDLLLVPVPPKSIVHADKLAVGIDTRFRLDVEHQKFYALLRERGVAVLDLAPDFLVRRNDKLGAPYCKQDTHWSGRGCVLAARAIAKQIADRPWLQSATKTKLFHEWKRVTIKGDLWLSAGPKPPAPESLALRFVGTRAASTSKVKKAALKPIAPSRTSPVILLGDSHDLVFHEGDDMHTRGAGLPDQLALELGFPVDLIAVRGSGATPSRVNLMRRAKANPKYLSGKKLVVWCFSAREFTESLGWQKVPVVP